MQTSSRPEFARLPSGLREQQPLLWLNPRHEARSLASDPGLDPAIAQARFARCAGLMAEVFPQLADTAGQLSSPLSPLLRLPSEMAFPQQAGAWFLKRDDALPVAGSVKARGGFHEVLAHVEQIGIQAGLLHVDTDRRLLAQADARRLLAGHTVAVGSTGNLGLAIGLIGTGLGLRAVVHMSSDAKAWKKQRLRDHGIEVVEHAGDYAAAVAAGRSLAESDPMMHFVDDEHSTDLFLGYAAAAQELAHQLDAAGRPVDADHPLFVYVPCGVGGAPGGILHGLKRLWGPNVHGFFAEPTASPCMLAQLASGTDVPVSVYDIGLDNHTEADGLAVGQASPLVAPLMASLLSGVFTVADDTLFIDALRLEQAESIYIEPSAAAGLRGPGWLAGSGAGRQYLDAHHLGPRMAQATHVIWSTGGSLVPEHIRDEFRARGHALMQHSDRT